MRLNVSAQLNVEIVSLCLASLVRFVGGIDSWVIAGRSHSFENLGEEPAQFADRSGSYVLGIWHTVEFVQLDVAFGWPNQLELEVFVARHVHGLPGVMPGSGSVVVDREVQLHLLPLLVFHLFGLDVLVVFLMRHD